LSKNVFLNDQISNVCVYVHLPAAVRWGSASTTDISACEAPGRPSHSTNTSQYEQKCSAAR